MDELSGWYELWEVGVIGDLTKYVTRPDPTWGVGIAHFQLWGWRYPSCAKGNYPFSTADKLFFNKHILMRRKITHCPVGLEPTTSQPHAEYWNFYVTGIRNCLWDTGFDETDTLLLSPLPSYTATTKVLKWNSTGAEGRW